MSAERAPGLVARLEEGTYRLLLRAYGRPFRGRYADELLAFFRQDRRAPQHRGLPGAWRFWRHTLRDLAAASLRDRALNIPTRLATMFRDLFTDLRLALRGLVREPGFGTVAVLSLALGIAAAATIFSVVDAAMLRALPFPDADRIVMVLGTLRSDRQDIRSASYPEITDWRAGTGDAFDGLAAFSSASVNLVSSEQAERVAVELVDPEYFDILGARVVRGRGLLPEDNRTAGASPVAVIAEEFWARRFGRDEALLGTSIRINERDLTVVGVLSAGFRGIGLDTEIWLPMMMADVVGRGGLLESRGNRWLAAVGRLAEGRSFDEAQQILDGVALGLEDEYPREHEDRTGTAMPLRDAYLDTARDVLMALVFASLLVLVIAAANVAGLLAVRWAHRQPEIAVRHAMGAGSGRIVRQIFAESALFAILGALVGLGLASWTLRATLTMLPDGVLPAFVAPALDARVLVATLASVVVVTAVAAAAAGRCRGGRGAGPAGGHGPDDAYGGRQARRAVGIRQRTPGHLPAAAARLAL